MKAVDPVCSMEVDTETAVSFPYKGENYYFCSLGCLEEFKDQPSYFLSGSTKNEPGSSAL
jgi:YHS domain-containing protein